MKLSTVLIPIVALILVAAIYPSMSPGLTGSEIRSAEAKVWNKSDPIGWGRRSQHRRYILRVKFQAETISGETRLRKGELRVSHKIYKDTETGDQITIYYLPNSSTHRVFLEPGEVTRYRILFYLSLLAVIIWAIWFFRRRQKRS